MSPLDRLLDDPWGPHDLEAAELNLALRAGPAAGRLVLIAERDGRFALARLPAARFGRVERLGPTYPTVLDGERDILRRRHAARP